LIYQILIRGKGRKHKPRISNESSDHSIRLTGYESNDHSIPNLGQQFVWEVELKSKRLVGCTPLKILTERSRDRGERGREREIRMCAKCQRLFDLISQSLSNSSYIAGLEELNCWILIARLLYIFEKSIKAVHVQCGFVVIRRAWRFVFHQF
jgi:hypothetical protein